MKLKNVEDAYELSPLQQGLLFHSVYAPESGVYVLQIEWLLRGEINLKAFEHAWQQAVNRHSSLRTCFVWKNLDKPLQVVRQSVKLSITIEDWSELSDSEQQARLLDFLKADRRRGFELSRAPLLRLALLRLDDEHHRLIWSNHHLLLDGWSGPLILKEVFMLYQGLCWNEPVQLAQPRPYRDYIFWLQSQSLEKAERYWREKLRGLRSPTTLALRRGAVVRAGERDERAEGEHEVQWLKFSASETAELNAASRRYQVTLNTIAQGAWSILLSRYSGERDVVFGTTVAGRPAELRGVEQMVGLFINTLPVRVRINERERVSELLEGLQAEAVETRQYEHSPLIEVAKWSEMPRGIPLFESILAFENFPTDASFGEQMKQSTGLEALDFKAHGRGSHALAAVVYPEQELQVKIEYEPDQFDDETISRMLGHFRQLLKAIATDPQQRICDLPLLTESERHQLLWELNDTAAEFPQDVCLHQLIEQQVARTPAATAVVCEGERLSYSELNARANRLAHRLQELGIGPEQRVGILLEHSPETMVAVLGILKAGGAYVGLDPQWPVERFAFALADAGARLLLTHSQFRSAWEGSQTLHCPVLFLDEEEAGLAELPATNLTNHVTPAGLAYLIYTSGSTGRPKAVMGEHRQVINYIHAISARLGLGPGAYAVHQSLAVDAPVTYLFAALMWGGTLHLIGRERASDAEQLGDYMQQEQVDFFKIAPSYLAALLAAATPEKIMPRRVLIVGGEAFGRGLAEQALRLGGGACKVVNHYGPTETTVGVLTYQVEPGEGERDAAATLPLGRPMSNMRVYVLDEHLLPAPIGVVGELYVGGAGVARGYLGRPELTAEKFVPDMYGGAAGARLYRTGDVGRWAPDGNVEFLGRIDHQVKIRGYRVEVEEVETVLEEHPAVRTAVVEARATWCGRKAASPLRLMVAIPHTKRLVSASYETGRASGCRITWCLWRGLSWMSYRERRREKLIEKRYPRPIGKPEICRNNLVQPHAHHMKS
jgi:amino acid adenylation domain-containing protein